MNVRLILTLIKKDLTLFSRDRFYFLLTVIGLIFYIVLYLVMPKTLNEDLKIAVYAPGMTQLENGLAAEQGIEARLFDTQDEMENAVRSNQYYAGIVLPPDLMDQLAAGGKPVVTVYFSSSAPEEVKGAVTSIISQALFSGSGQSSPVELTKQVLGPDLLGAQIPWRDRLIPLLAILILGTEIFSFASLVSTELAQNTVCALLVTPLRLRDLLTSKSILGIGLAFIQVLLFMAVIGGLSKQPLAIVLGLLLGSILVAGTGFLVSSLSRDMLGVTAWGMIFTIIFFIPSFGALFPGLISGWARVLPSYYLTDAISRLVNFGAGMSSVSTNLLIMLGWAAAFGASGALALRRRYR
jgi:ABC-2 type transport system permease protein